MLTQAIIEASTPEIRAKIAQQLLAKAQAGDLQAISLVLDRVEGKPLTRVESGEPGDFELSLDEARQVLRIRASRKVTDAAKPA